MYQADAADLTVWEEKRRGEGKTSLAGIMGEENELNPRGGPHLVRRRINKTEMERMTKALYTEKRHKPWGE